MEPSKFEKVGARKVPYDKDEIRARLKKYGAVGWMGTVYTDAELLDAALDAADSSLFEPAPQSLETSAVLEAINDTTLLDAVKEAHAETIRHVKETAQTSVDKAKAELETVKQELNKVKTELEKLKKTAKPSETKPAAATGTDSANPASSTETAQS